jgi:hypothetical protein
MSCKNKTLTKVYRILVVACLLLNALMTVYLAIGFKKIKEDINRLIITQVYTIEYMFKLDMPTKL